MTPNEFISNYRQAHYILMQLWTKACGEPGYNKEDWMILDNTLNHYAIYVANKVGYTGALIDGLS